MSGHEGGDRLLSAREEFAQFLRALLVLQEDSATIRERLGLLAHLLVSEQ